MTHIAPPPAPPRAAFEPKRLATVQARCALAGITLIRSHDDAGRPTVIATRWALCREFTSLDDVEQWLANVTGVRA